MSLKIIIRIIKDKKYMHYDAINALKVISKSIERSSALPIQTSIQNDS
jgi:hypothetical protein